MRRIPRTPEQPPYVQRYIPVPPGNPVTGGLRLMRYPLIIVAVLTAAATGIAAIGGHDGWRSLLILGGAVLIGLACAAPFVALLNARLARRDHTLIDGASYSYLLRVRTAKGTAVRRDSYPGTQIAQAEDWVDATPEVIEVRRRVSVPGASWLTRRTAIWHRYVKDSWGEDDFRTLIRRNGTLSQ